MFDERIFQATMSYTNRYRTIAYDELLGYFLHLSLYDIEVLSLSMSATNYY